MEVVKIERKHLKGLHDCYYGSSKKSRVFFSWLENVEMDELLDQSRFFITVCAIENDKIIGYGHLEKFPFSTSAAPALVHLLWNYSHGFVRWKIIICGWVRVRHCE